MGQSFPRRSFFKSGFRGIMAVAAGSLAGFEIPAFATDPQQPQLPKGIALTKEWQETLTAEQIIDLAKKGNQRFASGQPIQRDYVADMKATKKGQYPAAIVLSCIDSRAPAEIIFDAGIGNIFNARVAGNIIDADLAGSAEYACKVAGSKVMLVMGHTSCGAVKGAIDQVQLGNLTQLVEKIRPAVDALHDFPGEHSSHNLAYVDAVATKNVQLTVENVRKMSPILAKLEQDKQIMILGAMYNIATGKVEFLS
ncbi:MAG TPA: carbonic anhydrase family protein [Terriglobales bacterium]|nr:carbonic anhydrase family protein [Terriglobales bacterium]